MKLLDRLFTPITAKRLRRFREMKRAWWSFCLLLLTFALSLGANFICNDVPLVMKYKGEVYFPIVKFYPEKTFYNNDVNTRPNYKKLSEDENFKSTAGNWMVFPLYPQHPRTIIEQSEIDVSDVVSAYIVPLLPGSVDVKADGTIQRNVAAGYFFGVEDREVAGLNFFDLFEEIPGLKEAIQLRLDGKPAKPFEAVSQAKGEAKNRPQSVAVRLIAWETPAQVDAVRILLTERVSSIKKDQYQLSFDKEGNCLEQRNVLWKMASEEERAAIAGMAKEYAKTAFLPRVIEISGTRALVRFDQETVSWPYKPVKGHPMGIDDAGRDVMARVIYGYRVAMSFGLLLVVFSMVIGIIVGAVQGYFGGLIDLFSQRIIEIWQAMPFLYMMILLGSFFGRSFWLLLFVYGFFNWIGVSYYMRGEFLRLRNQQFVEAAKCLGVPTWKILFKHIFPNALVPVITFFPFSLVGAISSLTALDYLGFGMPSGTPSWGDLLYQAQVYRWAWWLILYPSMALFFVMLLGVFVGEGVRNAFDPRDYSGIK